MLKRFSYLLDDTSMIERYAFSLTISLIIVKSHIPVVSAWLLRWVQQFNNWLPIVHKSFINDRLVFSLFVFLEQDEYSCRSCLHQTDKDWSWRLY